MSAEVIPRPKAKRKKPKPSTDRKAALKLWADLVKAPGRCEYAGRGGPDAPKECGGRLEAAHIIRRTRSGTATDLYDGMCLCHVHHSYLDSHLAALITFVGLSRYEELQARADGHTKHPPSAALFWRAERERLTALAKARGLA